MCFLPQAKIFLQSLVRNLKHEQATRELSGKFAKSSNQPTLFPTFSALFKLPWAYLPLVTYFESVFAFLSHPAPFYPGRDLPLESYLSQRRLGGGRSTSRVRLPYTGTITMALKPPFPSLYCCPGLSGPEAFPRCRSLHGFSYPWVSGNHTVIALL